MNGDPNASGAPKTSGVPKASVAAPKANPGSGLWDLARAEMRLITRTGGYRAFGLFLAIVAVIAMAGVCYGDPNLLRLGPSVGYEFRASLEPVFLMLAPLVVGGSVTREARLNVDELVLSKPPTSETLAWGKLAGVLLALLVLIITSAAAAWIALAVMCHADHPPGPIVAGGLRLVLPLVFIAGLTFALVSFFRTPMVAGVVMVLQIGILAAGEYMVPALKFTYAPYGGAYALIGIGVAALAISGWERRRDPQARVPASLPIAAACLAAGLVTGTVSAVHWRGFTLGPDPALNLTSELVHTHISQGIAAMDRRGRPLPKRKIPPLPDQPLRTADGGSVRLSDWTGKALVVVFWTPGQPGSAAEAGAIEEAWDEAKLPRVGLLQVALGADPGLVRDEARAAGIRAPIVMNPLPDGEDAVGLADGFGLGGHVGPAVAGYILPDGGTPGFAMPLSQFPQHANGRSPRPAWRGRLVSLCRDALTTLSRKRS